MNPLSITLRNARTFREIRVELPEGLLAVLGENGAGKSTLIGAIDVALFGPDGRSLAPWYPRDGADEPMLIELVFEHAGETYRVRRSYSPKGRGVSKLDFDQFSHSEDDGLPKIGMPGQPLNPVIEIWEPLTLESQTETQALIEQMIGLSRETFRASSYLAQGDAGAFCNAAPRERKTILAQIVGLSDWDRFLKRAREERRDRELVMAETGAILKRADRELAERPEVERVLREAEVSVGDLTGQVESAASAAATAREQAAEARAQAERRTAAEQACRASQELTREARKRCASMEAEIARITEELGSRETLSEVAETLPQREHALSVLQHDIQRWRERAALLAESQRLQETAERLVQEAHASEQRAVDVLAHVGEHRCDRCDQILGTEAAEHAAASYRNEAATALRHADEQREAARELARRLSEYPDEAPDEEMVPVLQGQINTARTAVIKLARLEELDARRKTVEAELDAMRAEAERRETAAADDQRALEALGPQQPVITLDRVQLERDEHELRERLRTQEILVARYTERLATIRRVADQSDEARQRHDVAFAAIGLLKIMEHACGPNGIPALLLENVAIPQVEMEASRILEVLGGPATSVELRTLRQTKTSGVSDTLDIVLQTETGEAPYETFSGGEQARIAFALRLALAQLLAARKGSDTGLLVIDEIDGLDTKGSAALVGVLEELQARVPRIIIVSHQAELRDAFAQSLLLENVDGKSRIVEQE